MSILKSHQVPSSSISRSIMMINGILRPLGIIDDALLNAFEQVHREYALEPFWKDLAYTDVALPLSANGRFLASPSTIGLLLQAAQVRRGQHILLPLAGCGYTAALLLHLGANVVAIEPDEKLFNQMQTQIGSHELCRCLTAKEAHESFAHYYDAIILETTVKTPPKIFQDALVDDGCFVYLSASSQTLVEADMGLLDGAFSQIILIDGEQKKQKIVIDVPLLKSPPESMWWQDL